MSNGTIVLGLAVGGVLFALCAYFTRATPRRILGALIAGLFAWLVWGPVLDLVADRPGCWHYPASSTRYAPLEWYLVAALWPGASWALIGWRVVRRFRGTGLAVYLCSLRCDAGLRHRC